MEIGHVFLQENEAGGQVSHLMFYLPRESAPKT